ncbi:hypothetical protein DENSPDRAFT_835162 [Dentipellis sp. KUC8613]|nr:hypothetical protein DENSPDRAFT_835162 [Dentipellis sp. KUC8613]
MASHSQKSSLSSQASSDPGLFNKLVSDIMNTPDLSNEDLYEQANKHLKVLTLDTFEKYNTPKWITRVPLPTGTDRHKFNMAGLFDAMYQTASELNLTSGARYVSAAICACASLARSAPQEKPREQLAAELCKLGGTWVAYMLWPFLGNSKPGTDLEEPSAAATPTINETSDSMSRGNPVRREEKFREEVLLRDNYTCCITGAVQTGAPAHLILPKGTWIVKALEAAHIFRRSVSVFQPGNADQGKRASLAATYDILRHYCQLGANIAETMSQMDGAHNGILMQHDAHQAFDDFGFCMHAEEEANTYKLKIYTDQSISPYPLPTRISFADHSQAPTMSQMDGAHNGILLEHNAHQAFDDFGFCLQAEEDANTYRLKIYTSQSISPYPLPKRISFVDHSQASNNLNAARRSPCEHPEPGHGIALPSPELLRLHAALTGVFNLSAAAEFLGLFKNPPDSEGPAVSSDFGEDFAYGVLEYDGDKMSRMKDLTASVQGMPAVHSSTA